MPEENTSNAVGSSAVPAVSPATTEPAPTTATVTNATTVTNPPAPALAMANPLDPPAPPAEPEKDWTAEDTSKDKAKAPVFQSDPAYWADPAFFRLVILFAGWVLVLSVGGMLLLAANDKDIPQGIVAAASGLVGLLTGIFAAKSSKA
jgi:hypothetical protein